jgi:hypothetical protein
MGNERIEPRRKRVIELEAQAGEVDPFMEEEADDLVELIEDCPPADKKKIRLLEKELKQINKQRAL